MKHASNAAVPQKLNQEMSSNFDGNPVRVKMSNFPRKFDRILSNFCRKLVKMKNVMNLAKNWSVKQAIAADVPESVNFFPPEHSHAKAPRAIQPFLHPGWVQNLMLLSCGISACGFTVSLGNDLPQAVLVLRKPDGLESSSQRMIT